MAQPASSGKSPVTWGAVTVLLTVAILGTLWVPIYARSMPELGPFPFFYWYQLIWVPLTAVILWICYLLLRTKPARHAGPAEPPPAPELRPKPPPAVVFEPPPAPNLNAATVPPAFSAPPISPTPLFTAATWTVLVAADRGYYDRMKMVCGWSGSDFAFPAHASERRIPLVGKQMRIGRRNAARELEPEIDLADPPVDLGISRLHAMLIAAPDGTWSVLDPGSANGTLLNGRQIATGDRITLREGDRINLGAWTVITVHRG